MITALEEQSIKRACEKHGIDLRACVSLINDFGFATLNAEAEYWLEDQGKEVTESRVAALVGAADNAMEEAAQEVELEE